MGKTTDSFKREIGKNVGKAVSNWVFGDAHATPYRRVDKTKAAEIEARNRKMHQDQMFTLDAAVLQNIDCVANISIPDNKEELIALLSQLSTHLSAEHWGSGDEEEAKIRNKFSDALYQKYKLCLRRLQYIDNAEPQLFYFESILRKARRRQFWGRYKLYLIIVIFFYAFLGFGGVMDSSESGQISSLLIYWLISLGVMTGIWITVFMIHRNKRKKLQILRGIQPANESPKKKSATPEAPIVHNTGTCIDLNANGRIENRLAVIWNTYQGKASMDILSRRPVFSAEGERDSILFVGVNPSYIPEDDNNLTESGNRQSLFYTSQYGAANASAYFKELEKFADMAGYPYSHINLLYARENNRDLLLNTDEGFIREQLELTYDTILQLNPVAIVFFSEYCRQLIYGHDRWVAPDSESNGHYTLRGTLIPVFFTEDIMAMSRSSRESLVNEIRKSI